MAEISALETANGGVDHVVFNSTTGHVYFDLDSSGTLGAGDMEITLVGTARPDRWSDPDLIGSGLINMNGGLRPPVFFVPGALYCKNQ